MARNVENAAGVGLTIMILLEISSMYSNILPYPCDLYEVDPDSPKGKALRHSEIYATALALGFGAAGTLITQTPWPLLGAMAMSALMVWHYESARKTSPSEIGF